MFEFDAEALCASLIEQIKPHVTEDTALVGIHTGGVWLAERLHKTLGLKLPPGSMDISFYRDDLHAKHLRGGIKRSEIPFMVDNAHIIIVDDILFTGRTIRAALNELFDFGRPRCVELAVLIDRGGRQLPIAPRFCAQVLDPALTPDQTLVFEQTPQHQFSLRLAHA